MKPRPLCRSPSKFGGGEGFKSFLVFTAEVVVVGSSDKFSVMLARSCSVVLSASSTWSFFTCLVVKDRSRSSNRKRVSSEGKSIFLEAGDLIFSEVGEGNPGGVTARGSPDEAETERSRKRQILAGVYRNSGPYIFILFCCKGTIGSEASNLSELQKFIRSYLGWRADRESKENRMGIHLSDWLVIYAKIG